MKPILFNTEMVRAVLEGRKIVTRRIIKGLPYNAKHIGWVTDSGNARSYGTAVFEVNGHRRDYKTRYLIRDTLYVRETWSTHYTAESDGKLVYCYKADEEDLKGECLPGETNRWYPSIHMPKEAARLFLRITEVQVNKLQDMSGNDLEKEGIKTGITHFKSQFNNFGNTDRYNKALKKFKNLWDSTVQKQVMNKFGWNANPWVWVYEFKIISKEEAMKESEEE